MFDMANWPYHITLADVFAVSVKGKLIADIQAVIDKLPQIVTHIVGDVRLGSTDVWLLDNLPELVHLHTRLVDVLEGHGAVFNTPQYIRDGFIPHITKQSESGMKVGDVITIEGVSLVDMFPGGDWRKRKIMKHFVQRV